MPVDFSGTWTSVSSEGWAEVLQIVKVDKSKVPPEMKMTDVISQDGDTITIVTTKHNDPSYYKEVTVNVGSNVIDSVMGKATEFTTAWDGDKLVLTGVNGKGGSTRELDGAKMLITMKYMGAVAKTWFDKQ